MVSRVVVVVVRKSCNLNFLERFGSRELAIYLNKKELEEGIKAQYPMTQVECAAYIVHTYMYDVASLLLMLSAGTY